MKITVNTIELQGIIKKLDIVRPNKTKLPILEDIKVVAANNELIFTSTDLADTIQIKALDFTIEEYGEGLLSNIIDIKKSFKFLKDHYTIIECKSNYVELINGKKTIKNIADKVDHYPTDEIFNVDVNYNYNTLKLQSRMKKVLPAIAKNENVPVLTGVYFDSSNIVGVDGYRLHMNSDDNLNIERSFIVSGKTLEIYQKLIGKKDNFDLDINIDYENGKVNFQFDNITLTGRLVKGDYMNYKQIIPDSYETKVTVDKNDLKENVDFLSTYNNIMTMNINESLMNLKTSNQSGECKSDIQIADIKGSEIEIGVDANYFTEVLNCIDSDDVSMEFTRPVSPIVLRGENELYLVLPVRLTNKNVA